MSLHHLKETMTESRTPRAGRNAGQGVDPQGGRPQGPPPLIHVLPRPYRNKLTVPFFTSAASWEVVKIGSLPLKPPSAMTGLFVARMMLSAVFELAVATRYFAFP